MATEQFVTFELFNDNFAALNLGAVLTEEKIEYVIEDTSANFDPFFTHNELAKEFRVKIKQGDFEKAEHLLEQISLKEIETIDKEYYLFEFTDQELTDVVSKKDEWGRLNFILAQKILKDRGKEIRIEKVERIVNTRIEELKRPEKSGSGLITAGYIFAILGGLFGLFIGIHLVTYKRTMPNGEQVYAYSHNDRKQGNAIVIVGIFFILFWLVVKFAKF
ncbi:MAG: hypothetical protein ABIQ40_00170 [Bacteroidia bacterium]